MIRLFVEGVVEKVERGRRVPQSRLAAASAAQQRAPPLDPFDGGLFAGGSLQTTFVVLRNELNAHKSRKQEEHAWSPVSRVHT